MSIEANMRWGQRASSTSHTYLPTWAEWNPFIPSVGGALEVGQKIKVTVVPPGRRPMVFPDEVRVVRPCEEIVWGGGFLGFVFRATTCSRSNVLRTAERAGVATFRTEAHGPKIEGNVPHTTRDDSVLKVRGRGSVEPKVP